jgi:hypothetical protein
LHQPSGYQVSVMEPGREAQHASAASLQDARSSRRFGLRPGSARSSLADRTADEAFPSAR